jgi:hypothetical protein
MEMREAFGVRRIAMHGDGVARPRLLLRAGTAEENRECCCGCNDRCQAEYRHGHTAV